MYRARRHPAGFSPRRTSGSDPDLFAKQRFRRTRRNTTRGYGVPTIIDARCTSRGCCASIRNKFSRNLTVQTACFLVRLQQWQVPPRVLFSRTIASTAAVRRRYDNAGSAQRYVEKARFGQADLALLDPRARAFGLRFCPALGMSRLPG